MDTPGGVADARLERLCALNGVEAGYRDVFGKWQPAPDAAQRAVLAAMGVDARDAQAVEAAIAMREIAQWKRIVQPVTVIAASRLAEGMRIQLPAASLSRPLSWRIAQEEGEMREERFDPLSGQAKWRKPLYGQMIASAMLATGGGLLFTGKHTGEFMALDADTGETLWEFRTSSGVNAQPITWTRNGKQYVTVLSGLGGSNSGRRGLPDVPLGGSVWTFALMPE